MNPTEAQKILPKNAALAYLFTEHDDNLRSGFITRLDRSPVSRKKAAFISSFIYNLLILVSATALLTVAIARGLGPELSESLRVTLNIAQDLFLSWVISMLLSTTSVPFFFGECRLRWKYGFRPAEVVIRRSPPRLSLASEDYWRASVRAINPSLLYSNPTSILAGHYWVMEYALILDVYARMEKKEINEEDLEFTVWKESKGSWVGLELWRIAGVASDQQEVDLFKDFLRSKGKHELLSTWEITLESSTPTTQTPAKYRFMVKKFSQQGIDYETVWSQISWRPAV